MARILIVDDSPTEMFKMTEILKKGGHEIFTADGGEAGVAAAKEHLPDLVLMDVVMPGVNGFQATRQITKNASTSHIPVLIVTTKDQETDRLWGKRQGASGYLTKPIDEAALVSAINDAL
jgi:twitching motility two-component system response regulator PilH